MATATGISQAQVVSIIQQRLLALRAALNAIEDLYRWTSGLSQEDMEAATGLSATDASTYLAAVADANAEAQIHYTGQATTGYPQVTGPYPFVNTQAQVIGPQ